MKHDHRTLFRVVGGNSQRHVLNEYEIISYLVIQNAPTFYRLERNGKIEIQVKRTTSNSEFFDDVDGASRAVQKKLDAALQSINDSLVQCEALQFIGLPYRFKLYIAKFSKEKFTLDCFRVRQQTKKGWQLDTEKTRTVTRKRKHSDTKYEVEVPSGQIGHRNSGGYIYQHHSESHNPVYPVEKWIGTDLGAIKVLMRTYGEARIAHLRRCKQKQDEWVRLYKREREYE